MDAMAMREGLGVGCGIDWRIEATEAVMRIEKEIARVLCSQVIMRKANRALREGRIDVLRAMEFSHEHIAELGRRNAAGKDGFPAYALRGNGELIRALRRRQRQLVAQLDGSACATFVISFERHAWLAASVAPEPQCDLCCVR